MSSVYPATGSSRDHFPYTDFPLLIRRNFRAVDDPEPMDGRVNRHCKWSHFTDSAFFVSVLIERIHTWASFIDSDSLMAGATYNCGRVRREHLGKWPPGRQESCGSRSTAGKKTVFLLPKSR